MKRNHLVILIVVAALILVVWSGYYNYQQRRQAEQLKKSTQAVLVPDVGGGSSDAVSPEEMAAQDDRPGPLQNKPAPAFTLVDLNGKKVNLSDYRGKAVLVNFWATWCGPCKVEIPWFEQLHSQYAPQGFEILGVSNDSLDPNDPARLVQEKEEIRSFVAKMQMNYPVLLGGDTIADNYGGVDSLPTSFFVDRKGVVIAETSGLHSRDEVEADIKKALGSGGM